MFYYCYNHKGFWKKQYKNSKKIKNSKIDNSLLGIISYLGMIILFSCIVLLGVGMIWLIISLEI